MGTRRRTTKATRMGLYAASRYLGSEAERELGLQIPFSVYLQDPLVAEGDPKFGFDEEFYVRWEPGIADGPTSARFAIVDYIGDAGHLAEKATWDAKDEIFRDPHGNKVDHTNPDTLQFHQVNVWAILQRALAFFEEGNGLGRAIPFGFNGNRLIVVPHAGYGKNAFYDRNSKSLQFYYFTDEDEDGEAKRLDTCLSTDIINHEFGHAVLDGIRPYFFESTLVETGAFHEFVGDLNAILGILRNNPFRNFLAEKTAGDLSLAEHLSSIAEEFGNAVQGKPYLRTAKNDFTMAEVADEIGPHKVSEVLTGAMYEILTGIAHQYLPRSRAKDKLDRPKKAYWWAIQRMQRMALQPLDLLPPIDVTFKDYALAVLRAEELSNPTDPYGYVQLMLDVFVKRGILNEDDVSTLKEPRYLYDRQRLAVFHDVHTIASSRAAAYRFLDDNRDQLFIPAHQDVVVADLYDAYKLSRQGSRLPRQIILCYIWREDVVLEGHEFGEYEGQITTMLCGGTLVFDEHGNRLYWSRKPGTEGDDSGRWLAEIEVGAARRAAFLEGLARRIATGQVGSALGSSKGLLGTQVPPLMVRDEGGSLRFELSPHLSLSGEDHEVYEGGRRWEVSS